MSVIEVLRVVEFLGEKVDDEEIRDELRVLWSVVMGKVVVGSEGR